jgi:hypothetical protein
MGIKGICSSPTTQTERDPMLSSMRVLPNDVIKLILSRLDSSRLDSLRDIARCAEVCRSWRELARDPEVVMAVLRRIKGLTIFDGTSWKEHFVLPAEVNFDGLPPINPLTALPMIGRHLSLSIEGDAGVTLLTLPCGLTFNMLVELAKTPRSGKGMAFSYLWGPFLEAHGDHALSSTKRIMVTNNVLNNTRSKLVADQRALVEGMGSRLPRTLEAVALCATRFITTGEMLYNCSPLTYTRCEEIIRGDQMSVGGLSAAGLNVSNFRWDDVKRGAGAVSEVL